MLALLLASPASGTRPNVSLHPDPCHGQTTSSKAFQEFADSVWRLPKWSRGAPKTSTIASAHHQIYCSRGSGKRGKLKQVWRESRRAFYRHRASMLFRERVTPFYYGGHWWAAPYPIALCESGGDYFVGPYGAYGLIMEPEYMSPREQDLAAHRLYVEQGEGPWRSYESGCAYR